MQRPPNIEGGEQGLKLFFVDARLAVRLDGTLEEVRPADVGMTGDYDSVISMAKEEPLGRFIRKIPQSKFEPASGPATLCALAVETDDATGLATRVAPVRLGGALEEVRPVFWNQV
jgi:hypothetical protein